MTAASPACSPASSHSSPVCLPVCQRHLSKGGELRTNLHLRSGPGVWLLLGVVVVLVGMSVAIADYVSAAPKPVGSAHVKRMKLAGPVVMGVGLFIFICAATLLYENRDRELLRSENLDDLENLKGGLSWEDSQEQPSFSCQEQWECRDGEQGSWATAAHTLPLSNQDWSPPPPTPHRNTHNISQGPSPLSPLDAGRREEGDRNLEGAEEEEEGGGRSTLLARVVHHQEPTSHSSSPCPSISHSSVYSDSCNSSEVNLNIWTGSPLPPDR